MLRRTRPARVRQHRHQSRLGSWATLAVGPRRPAGEFPPDGRRCYANHSKITTITRTSASVPLRVRVPDLGIVEDCHAEGMFLSRLKAVPANWRGQRRTIPMTTRVRRLPTTREETETLP